MKRTVNQILAFIDCLLTVDADLAYFANSYPLKVGHQDFKVDQLILSHNDLSFDLARKVKLNLLNRLLH